MTVKNSFSKVIEFVFIMDENQLQHRVLSEAEKLRLNEAMVRLKNSKAWTDLEKTPFSKSYLSKFSKGYSDFFPNQYDAACFFCISGIKSCVTEVLTTESAKTPKDKSDDRLEIVRLIKRLKTLLNKHPYLDIDYDNPTIYEAAIERISEGVRLNAMSLPKGKLSEGSMFTKEIENELDHYFERQSEITFISDDTKLNTSQAYQVLRNYADNNDLFSLLERVEANARETASSLDGTESRPNSKNLMVNSLAIDLGKHFYVIYEKPLHSITTDFCSSVFNINVDEQAISKNWQRKKDNSMHNF